MAAEQTVVLADLILLREQFREPEPMRDSLQDSNWAGLILLIFFPRDKSPPQKKTSGSPFCNLLDAGMSWGGTMNVPLGSPTEFPTKPRGHIPLSLFPSLCKSSSSPGDPQVMLSMGQLGCISALLTFFPLLLLPLLSHPP